MTKFFLQVLCTGLVLFSTLIFAQSDDWQRLNLTLTDVHVIPAYQNFAVSGLALSDVGQGFCIQINDESFNKLQTSFHQAMDDWQSIQHLKFGPITYFNWQYRLQYWPDDNGTGGRQLAAMLAAQDEAMLDRENFSRLSVGVQGFPALERLLFSDSSLRALQAESYRCRLVEAIAYNIGEISQGLRERWETEFRASVALEDNSAYFEDAEDASIDFVKALVETIPLIQEQKLIIPLDDGYESWRERRAESWRSKRSLRNIKINISTLSRYFNIGDQNFALKDVFVEEDAKAVSVLFEQIAEVLNILPDSFAVQISDEQGYRQLQELEQLLDALYESLEVALKNTDLYLGFNSLDGD